jgi:hypothetical protein
MFVISFVDIQSKEQLLKVEDQSFVPDLNDTIYIDKTNVYIVKKRVIVYYKSRIIIYIEKR